MNRLRYTFSTREGRVAALQIVISLFAAFIGCKVIQNEISSLIVIVISSISAYGAASKFSEIAIRSDSE